jgi:hypothetical protein
MLKLIIEETTKTLAPIEAFVLAIFSVSAAALPPLKLKNSECGKREKASNKKKGSWKLGVESLND